MLGRLKEIVGFGKSGNRRETDLEFRIVNGVVEEKSCEPQAPYAGLQVLGEVQQSTFCETGVSRSSAFPSESLGTSKIHQGGYLEADEKSVPGRLPSIEKFWTYLQATGRARRTIKTYQYAYAYWKKVSRDQVYFLKISEIENLIKDMHPSTAKKKIAFLRKLAKWFLREGKSRLHIELAKLEVPKQVKRLPADRGAEGFVDGRTIAQEWCRENKREGIWLGLMLVGGLRISEIRTAQVGTQKGEIRVIGKGDKERIVPVADWLIEAMQTQQEKGQGGWRLKRKRIWAILAKQGQKHPHSLRHTYASELIRRGMRIEDAKVLLGHESIATTNIYTKLCVPAGVANLLDR